MNCTPVYARHTSRLARLALVALAGAVLGTSALPAADETLVIPKEKDPLGFAKPVPVHISGFTGEADAVLKNDLLFMGVQHVPIDQAIYLITGNVVGRVEGHVTKASNKA